MGTNNIITEEVRNAIQELKDELFGDLTRSLNELDDFCKQYVKQGKIEPGHESQYDQLQNEFKNKLDEFYNKCNKFLNNITR